MKIKTAQLPLEEVLALPVEPHRTPKRPSILFRTLLKLLSASDLKATHFRYTQAGMELLGKDEPCLILMNHSSFIDLKIAATVLYPRPFNIVCTSDGFVGKKGLMRALGCIPTQKFVSDMGLVRDMLYTLRTNRCSVLMYPEASYSFDGTATTLPESLGKCLKLLSVPVIFIRTSGAFSRDPLYNSLQLRNVPVSAEVSYLLSPQEIRDKATDALNAILAERFTFDGFRWQQENNIRISEPFRADGLNRVLYKCPACLSEAQMSGQGTRLCCGACGKRYELTEEGFLRAETGETEYPHIPDWYRWERACVREELSTGRYRLDIPVKIGMMVNMDCIYMVGEGRLVHTVEGFRLTGCGGKLDYSQKPAASYSLYSDYFWYEIGDMICIGNRDALYYCFPLDSGDVVAKTRLAAEELYKLTRRPRVYGASGSADTRHARA